MAPQKRTRQQAGDLSSESIPRQPPAKRIKTRTDLDIDTWESPPEFWDGLTKIELTHAALRELNRRTNLPRSRHSPANTTTFRVTRALTRLAKDGGPDVSDLRGYPSLSAPDPVIMSSRQTSQSGRSRSANPPSTQATSVTTKSKKSTTVYSRNFAQHLTDNRVYPLDSPDEPDSDEPDLDDTLSTLVKPRPSLSPSQFSEGAFKTFRRNNILAKDEDDVLANVLPTILGPNQARHPSARNTIFGNLEPLTDGTIAPAKPDLYYGASPEELSLSVRDELEHHIIPSSMHDKPMGPNFFVEVKGLDGSAGVALRQARYDGAIGSRAMHSLQNYGREQPQYDGQAYTFTSTYHDGTLKMYAHHSTAPTDGGPPGYHMTQLKAYAMTNDRDTFVQGATAFRNARDLAKQHRHNFIQAANNRASQQAIPAPQRDLTATAQLGPDEEGSDDEFVDCPDYSPPRTPGEPAPGITDVDDCSQASALPDLGDTTTSFASSITSDFAVDRSKRPRQPPSPHSKITTQSPPSKSRHPRGTSMLSQRSPVLSLSQMGEAERVWVKAYWQEGHICFRDGKEEIKTDRKDWTLQTQQDGSFCFCWQSSGGQSIWTKKLAAGDQENRSVDG